MRCTLRLLCLVLTLSSLALIAFAADAGMPLIGLLADLDFADFEQPTPASVPYATSLQRLTIASQ
jgi:hypothetical protein